MIPAPAVIPAATRPAPPTNGAASIVPPFPGAPPAATVVEAVTKAFASAPVAGSSTTIVSLIDITFLAVAGIVIKFVAPAPEPSAPQLRYH